MRAVDQIATVMARSDDAAVAGVAELIQQYASGYQLLDEYDRGDLLTPVGDIPTMRLEYSSSRAVIDEVRRRFPCDELFGIENGGAFSGILGAIEQTFGGQDLYPSTQEKAANLLYFVVKDHPFSDGNKRSAAALFTNYLNANGALRR